MSKDDQTERGELVAAEEVETVLADHEWWKSIASSVGAQTLGFSGRYAATFVWPDGTTSEIGGGLLKHIAATLPADGGVIQADREAAYRWGLIAMWPENLVEGILAGDVDDHALVQAFKNHRIQSNSAIAGLVEALDRVVDETEYVDNSYARAANKIARTALARWRGE